MDMRSLIDLVEGHNSALDMYWHGTDNKNGLGIMANGLRSAEIVRKNAGGAGGKGRPTGSSGTYLTPDLAEAIYYAQLNSKTAWGWVFGIAASEIQSYSIDEDCIGFAMRAVLAYAENPMAFEKAGRGIAASKNWLKAAQIPEVRECLTQFTEAVPAAFKDEAQRYGIGLYSFRDVSEVGSLIEPQLPENIRAVMAQAGCNIVVKNTLVPREAYKFRLKDAPELRRYSSGPFAADALSKLASRER